MEQPDRPATFREVFALSEFRALWAAQIISLVGDQLAKIALSVLVFQRTHSPLLTALAYAASFFPWVIGGPLLSGVADRWPRRRVLIVCDLCRASLVGAMSGLHVPVVVLCALLFGTELFSSPFAAARGALLPAILRGDVYVVGSSIRSMTDQLGQLLGFVVGGAVVAVVGARGGLGIDAASFLASAVIVSAFIRRRPASGASPVGRPGTRPTGGQRSERPRIWLDQRIRALLTLAWFVGFSVIPEGLAVPLAHRVHGGPGAVGLLLAASPLGTVAGVFILGRRVAPSRRLRLVPPLAALSVVPLIALAARPPLPVTLALLSASGLGAAYNLPANTAFVTLIPDEVRGRAFGLVNSGMYLAQGGGIVAAGALAQRLDPYFVVAIFGGLGLLTWCVRAAVWSQMFSTIPALVDLEPKTDEPIPVPATA